MEDGMILIYIWGIACTVLYALVVIYNKKD